MRAMIARWIREARSRTVYNVGSSGRLGAEDVAGLADEWLSRT